MLSPVTQISRYLSAFDFIFRILSFIRNASIALALTILFVIHPIMASDIACASSWPPLLSFPINWFFGCTQHSHAESGLNTDLSLIL